MRGRQVNPRRQRQPLQPTPAAPRASPEATTTIRKYFTLPPVCLRARPKRQHLSHGYRSPAPFVTPASALSLCHPGSSGRHLLFACDGHLAIACERRAPRGTRGRSLTVACSPERQSLHLAVAIPDRSAYAEQCVEGGRPLLPAVLGRWGCAALRVSTDRRHSIQQGRHRSDGRPGGVAGARIACRMVVIRGWQRVPPSRQCAALSVRRSRDLGERNRAGAGVGDAARNSHVSPNAQMGQAVSRRRGARESGVRTLADACRSTLGKRSPAFCRPSRDLC